jgi:hypothetical protein
MGTDPFRDALYGDDEPRQIKAAADLKEGDRLAGHWNDDRPGKVTDKRPWWMREDGGVGVKVEVDHRNWYVLPPFMAVVVEGTDG